MMDLRSPYEFKIDGLKSGVNEVLGAMITMCLVTFGKISLLSSYVQRNLDVFSNEQSVLMDPSN